LTLLGYKFPQNIDKRFGNLIIKTDQGGPKNKEAYAAAVGWSHGGKKN
jgi:hypothetical protein